MVDLVAMANDMFGPVLVASAAVSILGPYPVIGRPLANYSGIDLRLLA